MTPYSNLFLEHAKTSPAVIGLRLIWKIHIQSLVEKPQRDCPGGMENSLPSRKIGTSELCPLVPPNVTFNHFPTSSLGEGKDGQDKKGIDSVRPSNAKLSVRTLSAFFQATLTINSFLPVSVFSQLLLKLCLSAPTHWSSELQTSYLHYRQAPTFSTHLLLFGIPNFTVGHGSRLQLLVL